MMVDISVSAMVISNALIDYVHKMKLGAKNVAYDRLQKASSS